MKSSESEPRRIEDSPPFVEDDRRETYLPYGAGGVPFYIAIIWVGIIAAYPLFMWLRALPDLRRWMGP
ncbi:MAG: hypothetical protein WKG00_34590 [Polyangiaceae bacterium]